MFMFALLLGAKDLTLIVLSSLATIGVVSLLYRKDTEQEARLKGYSELSAWLTAAKLPMAAKIFQDLSVKDFSGCAAEVRHLVQVLRDNPQDRLRLFDENFHWQLTQRVTMKEDWEKIQTAVQGRLDAIKAEEARKLVALQQQQSPAPAAK